MNREQITQLLSTQDDLVVKALSSMGLDHRDKEKSYSTDQVADIEMILGWVASGSNFKDAKNRYDAYKASKDPLATLSQEEREIIEKVLDEIAGQSGAAFAQLLETRRNEIIGALLQRFDRGLVKNIVGVVQSPEFKQNFAQFLLTDDRTALPGKSAASLPSSKAGATNS